MTQEFSGITKYFWPVYKSEVKKVLSMALIMAGVLFNYTILRDVKDVFILSAPGSGAECFTFLKLWGTVPVAILLMALYTKLSLTVSKNSLFYGCVVFFATFYVTFNYTIYPNLDVLHASPEWIKNYSQLYPKLRFIIPLIGNWSFSMFYILAEIWGSAGLAVLFWQFANAHTKSNDARRLYSLFGLLGNLGVILSGGLLMVVSSYCKQLHSLTKTQQLGKSLSIVTAAMIIGFILVVVGHRLSLRAIGVQDDEHTSHSAKPKKKKLGFFESMKVIFSSKYLGLISTLVLSYGILINFLDVTFKHQIKLLYPDPNDQLHFTGILSVCTGITTVILMILGGNIARVVSWFSAAVITPVCMLIAGGFFFIFIVFRTYLSDAFGIPSIYIMQVSVVLGAVLISIMRGAKYSLFDPTKERAYIPLEENLKYRGKAAVDGVGGRLGKSGGGFIQQGLYLVLGNTATQTVIAPYLGVMVVFLSMIWIFAVRNLSHRFEALSRKHAA